MTTYPIGFASKAATSERLTISNRQSVTQSFATYATQVVHTASVWMLTWQWARMDHAHAESVNAWIASLQGQVGSFRYYPRQSKASTLTGITLSQAGHNYNQAILAAGWAANAATGLRAGQYFQCGTQLLMITTVATNADASGTATINFAPALRKEYAAGTALVFTNPCGVFRLSQSDGLGFGIDTDRKPEFSAMSAMEVA